MSDTHAQAMAQLVQETRECLDALQARHDIKPETLEKISILYRMVDYLETLAPEDYDGEMVSALERLIHGEGTSNDTTSNKEIALHNQGVAYFQAFQSGGNLNDLERAITSWQSAIDSTPDGHKNMPTHLNNLATALLTRFEHVGSLEDLEAAIAHSRKTVNLTPDDDSSKQIYLTNLCNALEQRYDRHGSLRDLKDAILLRRRAVDLTQDGDPAKPSYLSNLGVTLGRRFDRHGSLADLEEGVSQSRKAVDLTPDDHSSKPMYFNNLGIALERRFEQDGSLADLDEAIVQKRKAVNFDLAMDGHPDQPMYFSSLGSTLETRFNRQGLLVDLEEAIMYKRMAVDLTLDSHPNQHKYRSNLGIALETRFGRHGSLADLEESILQKRKVIDLLPSNHPDQPKYLSNLGVALETRFSRYGPLADLEEAVLQKRKAVSLTPDDHPNKSMYLNNLGNSLRSRFKRCGLVVDLEDAMAQMQKAVDLTPDSHPDKSSYLNGLGNTAESKFLLHEVPLDLDNSILHRQNALRLMPKDHSGRAVCLNNLSRGLLKRFERLAHQDDLQNALSAAQEAAESLTTSSKVRLRGALLWAECCQLGSTSSLPAFGCAVQLLPRMAWLGLVVDDQYHLLSNAGSTTRDAVAAAIVEGEGATAIEWAEQGRSIVWQNLLNLRMPLEELQIQYPELATRLQGLSYHLERPAEPRGAFGGVNPSVLASYQKVFAMERDILVEEIRSKPGFESFMKAKRLEQLAPAAQGGPIIFLNLGKVRCDALALLSDDNGAAHVVPIPLERVTLQKAAQLSQKLVDLLRIFRIGARGFRKPEMEGLVDDEKFAFREILQTLWLDYVKPVVDALAYSVNLDSPPRLWWCTSGELAFPPIHAAGLYDTKDVGHKLSDYVVSSYTPSVTALLPRSLPSMHDEYKILTVAMPTTPGASSLPKTEEEVENVQRLAANMSTVGLMNETATKERVLKEIEMSNWIHLACHGKQTGGKPMESGLMLYDGKLELSEIVKTRLPNADFAFLSACETAVGDGGVPEESAHLAAGMLFAGYRGVVATMWSIQDDIAPRVAGDFYRYMFRQGPPKQEEAAYALHRAVRSLQESGVHFTAWVPFIHIGR